MATVTVLKRVENKPFPTSVDEANDAIAVSALARTSAGVTTLWDDAFTTKITIGSSGINLQVDVDAIIGPSDGTGVVIGAAGTGANTGSTLQLPSLTTTERGYLVAANGMAIYNETAAEIQGYFGGAWNSWPVAERRDYGVQSSDPSSPSPSDGDLYYNSTLDMEMRYDGGRSKWLSVESPTLQFGRDGITGGGAYYRVIDGQACSATIGLPSFFNGTVVALGYTRSDTDSATFEVVASGTATGAELLSTAVTGYTNASDSDFDQGDILAARNKTGSNSTTDGQVWVKIRWRA